MTTVILRSNTVAVCLIILVAACGLIYFPSMLLLKFRRIHLIGTQIVTLPAQAGIRSMINCYLHRRT